MIGKPASPVDAVGIELSPPLRGRQPAAWRGHLVTAAMAIAFVTLTAGWLWLLVLGVGWLSRGIR